ncbi:hypothetical protein ACFPOE_15955 [Caenimonas terrae]|uniref:Uncharacterized protein n=1 Tax=Caenimonas terrae TaxID=696074 RepID=A0ABW0NIB0_9BURK
MKPSNQPAQGSGDTRPAADSTPAKTPNADMQPEDTGSGDSEADSGSAATRAMKQTSKTAAESKR